MARGVSQQPGCAQILARGAADLHGRFDNIIVSEIEAPIITLGSFTLSYKKFSLIPPYHSP
jgi:hypothetical protein